MDIYSNPDGVIDIGKVKHELESAFTIAHEPTRRSVLQQLNVAILLDIASSLRPLAAEALAAMPEPSAAVVEPESGPVADMFVEGDFVVADGMDEAGRILRFGYSEGAAYADLQLTSGVEVRTWVDRLIRVVDGVEERHAEPVADDDVDGLDAEPNAESDDVEDDFMENPLDALREKATKKATKK